MTLGRQHRPQAPFSQHVEDQGPGTGPELRLRSAFHRMGLRFRVCRKDLPGKLDVVFPGTKKGSESFLLCKK